MDANEVLNILSKLKDDILFGKPFEVNLGKLNQELKPASRPTPAAPDLATPCQYCGEISKHLTGCPGDQSKYAKPVS